MSEYVLLFFLVVGAITVMSIYVRRGVQARIRDTRKQMFNIVKERTGLQFFGNLEYEYEPYYINATTVVTTDINERKGLFQGGSFRKDFDDTTVAETRTITAPPGEAN